MLTNLRDEVKLGLRALLHDRGFALAAVLSIGLGVGANSALFSLVDQALLRMLPVRDPERLVLLNWNGTFIGKGWGTSNLMSYPFYRDLRSETQVFDGVFARFPTGVDLMIDGTPEQANAEIVTGSYFPVLGVRPLLGRLLDDSDDQQPNAHPVVVVSAAFWKNRLGGRADIVGMKITINRHPMTVIGVADPQFHGIDWGGVTAIWVPTMMKREATPEFDWLFDRRGKWLHVFGRLKPGVPPDAARAQLQPWFKAMLQTDTTREDWPQVTANQRQRYLASTLDLLPAGGGRSDLRRQLERPLLVLLAATAFVLLLSCLNVANLSIARGFARRRETALKLALGASNVRVAGGLLIQSGMLAVGGAVVGLLVVPAVVRALISFIPQGSAPVDLSAEIDVRVFGFALASAVVTTIAFGIAPALQAAREQPTLALKEDTGRVAGGLGARKILVTAQIALALVLLVGAGLFVRTLGTLRAKGPGFITTNQYFLHVDPARNGYSLSQSTLFMRTLLARFRGLADVDAAAIGIAELLGGGSWNQPLTIAADQRMATERSVHLNAVSPGYFATLGARVVAGRDFTERDSVDLAESVQPGAKLPFHSAIVNEQFVGHYLAGRNPIGVRIGIGNGPNTPTNIEIVGVVSNFSYRGLREIDDQTFFPFFEGGYNGGTFYVRTRTGSAAAALQATARQLDPSLRVKVQTMDDQMDRALTNERLLAELASAFAALAVLLVIVGVYGVMSFVVTRRTREIGIRIALGASSSSTTWLFVRETAVMLAVGIAIAFAIVSAVGRLVESELFGVKPLDGMTIAGAALLVAMVSLAAIAVPIRRAVSISPIEALRSE
jgi:putative ABC transport system permease protein